MHVLSWGVIANKQKYVVHGEVTARATEKQVILIEEFFGQQVLCRFSEILFHPYLRLKSGKERGMWGYLDTQISGCFPLVGWIAQADF